MNPWRLSEREKKRPPPGVIQIKRLRFPLLPLALIFMLFAVYLHYRMRHASIAAYGKAAVITARDPATGIGLRVDNDGRTVIAALPKKVLWEVDAVEKCPAPIDGEPVVRSISVTNGTVWAIIGRHDYVSINLHSGWATWWGSN